MVLGAIGGILGAVGLGKSIYDDYRTNKNIAKQSAEAQRVIDSLNWDPSKYMVDYRYYDDPELYNLYLQDQTAYNDVAVDPYVLAAQNQALEDLINLSEAKGLNAIDQQALQEIVNEENKNLQGQNQAILQNAMERGIYGSGLELAQRLQNAQSGANRMSNRDMEVMSQAQQRALDALSSYGDLAGNIRTQDYNEQARRASAIDAINQYNTNQMTNQNKGNVDNLNTVGQSNVDIYNKNQDANVQGYDKNIQNQFNKAGLATGQYQNNINTLGTMNNTNQAMNQGLMTMGSTMFGQAKKDEKKQ